MATNKIQRQANELAAQILSQAKTSGLLRFELQKTSTSILAAKQLAAQGWRWECTDGKIVLFLNESKLGTMNKKIQIKESELRETLREALNLAESGGPDGRPGDFTSGWGFPVYVNEDGSLHIGGMISDNSWQPDAIEIVRVKNWNVDDNNDAEYNEDWSRDDEVDAAIENVLLDEYMTVIENNIRERNEVEPCENECPYEIVD